MNHQRRFLFRLSCGPRFTVAVTSGASSDLLHDVHEGTLHAAVTADADHVPIGLDVRWPGSEVAALIVHQDHPLAPAPAPVVLRDLVQEQVFWPGPQATVNVMTQQTLRTAGVYLPRVRLPGGFLAVREAVPERLGVTVAPPSVFRRELAAGWVRRRDVADLQVTPGYVLVSRPRGCWSQIHRA